MPDIPIPDGYPSFRTAIDAFLHERLQAKLVKLSLDDPKRAELIAQHRRDEWLAGAASRVKHLQAVTHSLKPMHPDARGTNLNVAPASLPTLDELGSHTLGKRFAIDIVGNAASLDVYKLLKLKVGGRSLLQALEANNADALHALADDPVEARSLRDALVSVTAGPEPSGRSHAYAKQLYWLTGDDATDNADYHLLAPLYATSLAHAVFTEVQDARFGEANRIARHARREGLPHDAAYREYRDIAVQKIGGSKPQNISQLNSERGGNNYLLASLPPPLQSARIRLPVNAESIFEHAFGSRPEVRAAQRTLQTFLLSDPPRNADTRDKVTRLVDGLVDELVVYADELLSRPAGWTREPSFDALANEEKLWLDPLRAELPDQVEFARRWLQMDWPIQIGERFGKWLNAQLRDWLSLAGFDESRQWRRILLRDDGSWARQLRDTRARLDAPAYAPACAPLCGSEAERTAERSDA